MMMLFGAELQLTEVLTSLYASRLFASDAFQFEFTCGPYHANDKANLAANGRSFVSAHV